MEKEGIEKEGIEIMGDPGSFINGLQEWKLVWTEKQLHQFEQYYDLLIKWNQVMNLTAITEYEEVITKHFLDSLSLVNILPELKLYQEVRNGEESESKDKTKPILLDLGTGAGFPGIPLKILFPELQVVLMDSLNKRVQFLNEVIQSIGLSEIKAVHARAEEAARKQEYREKFDFCVSRAVAKMNSLSEYCLPFVKTGGKFIAYKSGRLKEELEEANFAIGKLQGKIKKTKSFCLPNSDIERSLVLIEKVGITPTSYPRGGGKPLKDPLGKK